MICDRCHGSGHLACYNHIERGICFECNGTGLTGNDNAGLDPKKAYAEYRAEQKANNEKAKQIRELQDKLWRMGNVEWESKMMEQCKTNGDTEGVEYFTGLLSRYHEKVDAIHKQIEQLSRQ